MANKYLVADDSTINRLIIKNFLEKNGNFVEEANDGNHVVNLINEGKKYDIIWMDIQMPEMDGIDCCKKLRNELKYHGTIIGITSHVDNELILLCLQSGMNDIISKPILENTINQTINSYAKLYGQTS